MASPFAFAPGAHRRLRCFRHFRSSADTAARVVQPRFYQDSEARMVEALGRIRALGCRFLVAGRVGADGRFVGLEGLIVPPEHRDLFLAIPEAAFRVDISSTEIRAETAHLQGGDHP